MQKICLKFSSSFLKNYSKTIWVCFIHQIHSPRLHCRCPESLQGMPIDQTKWIFLFLIPTFPPVQHIWFCSCRMPSPGLLLLQIRWWRKQMEREAVNLFCYILEHLPLKGLAKGLALKTTILASSWWESLYPCLCLACLCIPEGTVVGYLHDPLQQTLLPLTGVAICTFHCVPLQSGRKRLARAPSMAS